jgi:spermidine/putrescine transport system substrate-binding protein
MQQRPLPQDPIIRQLISQARASQLSRRTVLAGMGASATALTLAACTPGGGGTATTLTPAKDLSDSEKVVTWANWAAYLDEADDGSYPTLDRFIEQTGIDATYLVEIDDNNTFYGKIKDQLALGQDTGYDTFCLTEWMVSKLIRAGFVQDLDEANIPNKKNLTSALLNPDFDPGRAKSMPWQNGFAGICWNKTRVPEGIASVSDLWKPELAGKVGVLSEMRDTMGLIMLDMGVDITGDWGDDEYQAALDVFSEQVSSGQIRNVKGNSYLSDLASEDTWAAICWSGDITVLNAESGDNWEFAFPEAGATLWGDTFVVPMGSPHKTNAETLINYYYEPEVAAEVALWVNFITPVDGAYDVAVGLDPELAENQLIFPTEETLAKSHIFRSLTDQEDFDYNEQFQNVVLGA